MFYNLFFFHLFPIFQIMAQAHGLGKKYLKAFFKGFFVAVPVTVTFLDRVACVARVEGASMQVLLEISFFCQEIKQWLSTGNSKVEKLVFSIAIKWSHLIMEEFNFDFVKQIPLRCKKKSFWEQNLPKFCLSKR